MVDSPFSFWRIGIGGPPGVNPPEADSRMVGFLTDAAKSPTIRPPSADYWWATSVRCYAPIENPGTHPESPGTREANHTRRSVH